MEDKKYYSREETDKIMYSYIRKTAKELKIDLTNKSVKNNKISYV
jgi:hypothetical protein